MLSVVHSIYGGFDTSRINDDEDVREKLIRLFDHENLVRIMDIQFDKAPDEKPLAQLGFEHMSRGTLNRILFDKVYVMSPLFPSLLILSLLLFLFLLDLGGRFR